jgi:hypothetical protein
MFQKLTLDANFARRILDDNNNYLKCEIIEIGDWDMDATAFLDIAHGLSNFKNIRGIHLIIRDDFDTRYMCSPFCSSGGTSDVGIDVSQGSGGITTTNIRLRRSNGGQFDNLSYDSTSYNRGWVFIWYEE